MFSGAGKILYALEIDADLNVPNADFKMKARVGKKTSVVTCVYCIVMVYCSINQDFLLNVECFHMKGRIQCAIELDRDVPFPHVSNAALSFVSTYVY